MMIDVHSHMVLPCYLKGLDAMGVDPLKEEGFPVPAWDVAKHLALMEEVGISRSVLSLSSPHIHHGDGVMAVRLAQQINDETAAICQAYSDRFSFVACLPMPEIEASVVEINRTYDELGAVGIKVASNSNGVYLGDARFDPIFEELNKRHAVLLIHPSRPSLVPTGVFTEGPVPLFEFLGDTTRAVINMITHGTLTKYPNIRVVVPHNGAFLSLVAHRLMGISKILVPQGIMKEVDVMAEVRKLYFDVAGDAIPAALPALLEIADPTHLLYGSDYPYTPAVQILNKKTQLMNHPTIGALADKIFHENAERLFDGMF